MDKIDVRSMLTLAERVVHHYQKILSATPFHHTKALDLVTLQMASRILEIQRACQRLVENHADTPVAMSCLARAHYESVLNLMSIFVAKTEDEREELARKFIEFAAYQQIHQLRPDNKEYRESLEPEEQKNFDRRVKIYRKVKANFSEKQKEQKEKGEVTWNGLGFAGTAKSIGWEEQHKAWYGMLCLATHPSASMLHKSVTFTDTNVMLSQLDQGVADSVEMLLQVTRWTFTSAAFIRLIRQIEIDQAEGIGLCSALDRQLLERLYTTPSGEQTAEGRAT